MSEQKASQTPFTPPPLPQTAEVSTAKLIFTLAFAGVMAGVMLVFAFYETSPAIEAHKAEVLRAAIGEVLKSPARYETLYVLPEGLSAQLPSGAREKDFEKVFYGFDAQDAPIGFAIVTSGPGFQDQIKLIFGFDPRAKCLLGIKVLESKETPGLGDKIEKDAGFVAQFVKIALPLLGVKKGKKTAANEVEMITGATISSRAVIRNIDQAVTRLQPLIEAYFAGQSATSPQAAATAAESQVQAEANGSVPDLHNEESFASREVAP